MAAFSFTKRMFHATERALYWPDRRALLVADLHFEKASWFARAGQMLPPFDSRATCEALLALVERLDPAEIWALGDSFHDDDGPGRIDAPSLDLLARIGRGRRLVWIAGNHDDGADLPGERHVEIDVDGIVLRHEALPGEVRPEISGHFHPKIRVKTAQRSVSRPCYVCDGQRIILPAFGSLTGGLDVHDPAITRLLGDGAEALIPAAGRLLRFAVRGGSRSRPAPAAVFSAKL
jgi:uncharacterized protein